MAIEEQMRIDPSQTETQFDRTIANKKIRQIANTEINILGKSSGINSIGQVFQ
jgi:hypothetical protein